MKHLRLISVVLLASLWSCAPKYGAHFQKTSDKARFYSTYSPQKIVTEPKALASIAPDRVRSEISLAEPDKELMDKLLKLQHKQNKGTVSGKRWVQEEKEALVLEAVRSKLGSMSPGEKKAFRKAVKQAKSEIKSEMTEKAAANHAPASIASGMDVSESTLLLVLITILIPPLGVYLYEEEINEKFWIALVLTLLFYIPGLIYSLIVIL